VPDPWKAIRRKLLAACVAIISASQARAQAPAAPDSAGVERHIRNITSHLLVETSSRGIYSSAELRDRMAFYHTPGVSVAVVNNYQVEWARAFGVRDAATRLPLTPATRFQAGSVSKPTFAVAVMRLVEKGEISLDQDVNRYLTSWKVSPVEGWQPRLTLRELLGHGGGLTVHGFLGYQRSEPIPTLVQVLDGVAPANSPPIRVNILPGIQSRYSGGGITVAQVAVTDHLGRTLPDLASELVFQPLGMSRSGYDQPPRDTSDIATGHYWMARPLSGKWHIYPELAAAGLWTTPSDLARLGASLQRAMRGDSGEVLQPASVREMLTPQHLQGDRIGISFFLEGKADSARFQHGGWDEGFLTTFVMYVHGGRGAVVMVNSTEAGDLMQEVLRAIAKEYSWPGYVETAPQVRPVAGSVKQRYIGQYLMSDSSRAKVQQTGDTLWLRIPPAGRLKLDPISDTVFVVSGLNTRATFRRSQKGSWMLVLQQDDVTLTGRKL